MNDTAPCGDPECEFCLPDNAGKDAGNHCSFCPMRDVPLVEASIGVYACSDCFSDLHAHEEC
jgi:hypothetical protein